MNKIKILAPIVLLAFNLSTKAQTTTQMPMDGFYERSSPLEREVIPYDHIRESDVFWQKRVWRIIDSKEKINLPFRYEGVDWKDMSPLITILLDGIKSGEVTVYSEDNFKTVKPSADVLKIGGGVDTIQLYDQYGTFLKDSTVTNEFDPSSVTKFRIKEDWFIDKESSTMQVRIIAVAPVYVDPDAGDIAMFWAYYPDLRKTLVKKDAFNPYNDAVRMSWDDVFESRLFSSYIYKESNVFDRRIQDYKTGVDALVESDRIKNEIFEKEHDMWSF